MSGFCRSLPCFLCIHYMKNLYTLFFLLFQTLALSAQSRSASLTIEVTSVQGDDLADQPITLIQTDYEVSYGKLRLNGEGICTLKVYPGNHRLVIERDGFETLSCDFVVAENEMQKTVSVVLTEKTRMPYALNAKVHHDVFTGKNSILFEWNCEAPAFFDDFESYSPFAVSFGEWTGIDADLEAAAPLIGSYPNRGVMQFAQIINPLAVTPTWWYDYPVLRPFEGQQYVGFTRTNSGNQNDDWLISPAVMVGTDNVLQFMGKAADQYPERFMVYVTEKLDGPTQEDFVRIDKDNYETVDYRGWHQFSYDLSAYAGRQIKFAIRYISHYNRYGSFMLMIDNVFVGQPSPATSRPSSVTRHPSPANPNEQFHVYLDGELVGTTGNYSFELDDVVSGEHMLGVRAAYIQAQSEMVAMQVTVPEGPFAAVTFQVQANSVLNADGQKLSVTSMATSETWELMVVNGQAVLPSLPLGQYVVNIAEGAFLEYQQVIDVSADATVSIELTDRIVTPYNITATVSDDGRYTLRWNQELLFSDSFEEYADFATGLFGNWLSIDRDQMPVYPIALGGMQNIVSFPGSGTASNPTAIAPMVFNPYSTTPAMMPVDPAIGAPTGKKTVIFFSSQRWLNDKWLISPLLDIHDGYVLSVKAKGYSSLYPESMEFCFSDGSTQPDDFSVLSTVSQLSAEQWSVYETDLSQLAGQTIRLAIHYNSYDAFLAQVDDFTVGLESGEGEIVDYGNIVRFDILLDGQKIAETATAQFTLPVLSAGSHVVGIRAIYQNGESELAEYVITATAITHHLSPVTHHPCEFFNLNGQKIRNPNHGVFVVRQNGKTKKIMK